ncbi:MAG: arsenate reductase [Bacteroidales bacterium]|nr:MAG: arsenate reductase [Bacteroidales bacterium]
MSYIIFHNTRCKHSRSGLDYLKSKTSDFVVRDYITDVITMNELKEILLKTNLKPSQIVRTNEEYYKSSLKGKNFTDDEWIKILIENPKLIQRPIVVGKYKAIIANPPSEIDRLF